MAEGPEIGLKTRGLGRATIDGQRRVSTGSERIADQNRLEISIVVLVGACPLSRGALLAPAGGDTRGLAARLASSTLHNLPGAPVARRQAEMPAGLRPLFTTRRNTRSPHAHLVAATGRLRQRPVAASAQSRRIDAPLESGRGARAGLALPVLAHLTSPAHQRTR